MNAAQAGIRAFDRAMAPVDIDGEADDVALASPAPETAATTAPAAHTVCLDLRELEQHRNRLIKYATWTLGNRAAAEDAVQETLLAALQSGKQFAGRSSVKTWLFGILKHKITDAFRLQSRERPLAEDDELASLDDPGELFAEDGHWRTAPSHWAEPEAALNQRRFMEALQGCIDRLPKRSAQVFTMRELLGLETADICRELDITESHCYVLLHRARMTLRRLLEETWFRGEAVPR